jgi:hypothetical protein
MVSTSGPPGARPCRREIPLLNEIREQRHATEGVEIVGIAVDFRDEVLKYPRRTRISYPLLMGEEDGLRPPMPSAWTCCCPSRCLPISSAAS